MKWVEKRKDEMDKFTKHDLYKYLLMVQEAAKIQMTKVDPKAITEEEWAEFCMREGAARLASELIRRYGLDVSEN